MCLAPLICRSSWPPLHSFLDTFIQLSQADVDRVLGAMRPTTWLLEPCPAWPVKASGDGVQDPLRDIVNLSLTSRVYPGGLKESVVVPRLKQSLLDPMDLTNYCPVSNISFLGKVIEWWRNNSRVFWMTHQP